MPDSLAETWSAAKGWGEQEEQKNDLPINRKVLMAKTNDIYWDEYGVTRSTGFLTIRWVSCFLKRHPDLSLRYSQVIKRARTEVSFIGLREFFNEYMKRIIERNESTYQVFNIDEMVFSRRAGRRR